MEDATVIPDDDVPFVLVVAIDQGWVSVVLKVPAQQRAGLGAVHPDNCPDVTTDEERGPPRLRMAKHEWPLTGGSSSSPLASAVPCSPLRPRVVVYGAKLPDEVVLRGRGGVVGGADSGKLGLAAFLRDGVGG